MIEHESDKAPDSGLVDLSSPPWLKSGGHNKNSYTSPGPELLPMSQSLSSFSSVTMSQWLSISQGSNSCSGV